MVTNPVGDLLTRVRNAALARKPEVTAPYSKAKNAVAQVLKSEGYLSEVGRGENNQLVLTIALKRRRPVITGIRNISRPGLRIYRKAGNLPRPLGGAGVSIISTSRGVMTNKEAKKLGLGGEVLGEIW